MARRADRAGPSMRIGPVAVRLRPLRAVRVRITLAAVVVTAAAMAISGWLLVRSVEDAQLAAIRQDAANLLDQVAERLADGVRPEETVRPDELGTNLVEIEYEDGRSTNLIPVANGDEVGVSVIPHHQARAPLTRLAHRHSMSPTRAASPKSGTLPSEGRWPPAGPSTPPPAR
jgi:hypothetical protein